MSDQDWKSLIDSFSKIITSKKTTHQEICDNLDRLSDAILSGTEIPKKHVPEMLSQFLSLFDPKTFWCYKHTACFAMNHIIRKFKDDLKSLGFYGKIQKTFVGSITDSKREFRDAIAQSLGVCVETYGKSYIEEVYSQLMDISKEQKDYQFLEGLVMAVGYLLSALPENSDLSQKMRDGLVGILFSLVITKQFGNYGRFVRYYVCLALERIVRRNHTLLSSSQLGILKMKILPTLMCDTDFQVRKACSLLFFACSYIGSTYVKSGFGEKIYESLIPKLSNLGWEGRHGIFLILQKCMVFVKTKKMFHAFSKVLSQHLESTPEESGKVVYQANASSGYALICLGVEYSKFMMTKSYEKSEFIGDSEIFNILQKGLMFMCNSGESYILDTLSQSIQLLLLSSSSFSAIQELTMKWLLSPSILGLLFKNKFHAAMPIKNAATVAWRVLEEKKGLSIMTSEISLKIIRFYCEYLKNPKLDYEVVESILKAFGELIKKAENSFSLKNDLHPLVSCLLKESSRDTIRRNSEVTRSASLHSLLHSITSIGHENFFSSMKKSDQFFKILDTCVVDIFDESVSLLSISIIGEFLKFKKSENSLDQLFYKYYSHVFVFSFLQDDQLKNRAKSILTILDMSESFQCFVDKSGGGVLFTPLLSFLSGFNTFFEDDVEYDLKEGVSKAISPVITEISGSLKSLKQSEIKDDLSSTEELIDAFTKFLELFKKGFVSLGSMDAEFVPSWVNSFLILLQLIVMVRQESQKFEVQEVLKVVEILKAYFCTGDVYKGKIEEIKFIMSSKKEKKVEKMGNIIDLIKLLESFVKK